ncbi:MAG: NADH-quinone oxidoreductase subunit K [Candidatus Omnitrophica bacterium]|nr:NADH-quinone oxidoreductase subunit K [Candidatus Omnitrophota bacterium]
MTAYILCLILFSIGLYATVRKRNLIKIIIGIGIMEYAVNLFIVLGGYKTAGRSPIFSREQTVLNMVDPLPQAMVMTVIAIEVSILLLLVAIAIKVYDKYETFDITKINNLKG